MFQKWNKLLNHPPSGLQSNGSKVYEAKVWIQQAGVDFNWVFVPELGLAQPPNNGDDILYCLAIERSTLSVQYPVGCWCQCHLHLWSSLGSLSFSTGMTTPIQMETSIVAAIDTVAPALLTTIPEKIRPTSSYSALMTQVMLWGFQPSTEIHLHSQEKKW